MLSSPQDGYDETICPTDFRHAGQIVDDELNALMVRPLLPGVTLHAVIDACHSGTALDLPYRAKVDGAGRWYWKGRHMPNKATRGGEAWGGAGGAGGWECEGAGGNIGRGVWLGFG